MEDQEIISKLSKHFQELNKLEQKGHKVNFKKTDQCLDLPIGSAYQFWRNALVGLQYLLVKTGEYSIELYFQEIRPYK